MGDGRRRAAVRRRRISPEAVALNTADIRVDAIRQRTDTGCSQTGARSARKADNRADARCPRMRPMNWKLRRVGDRDESRRERLRHKRPGWRQRRRPASAMSERLSTGRLGLAHRRGDYRRRSFVLHDFPISSRAVGEAGIFRRQFSVRCRAYMCAKTICVKTLLCALPPLDCRSPRCITAVCPRQRRFTGRHGIHRLGFDTFAPDSIGDYPPGTVTTTKNRTLFWSGLQLSTRRTRVGEGPSSGCQARPARRALHGHQLRGGRQGSPLCNPKPRLDYAKQVLTDQTSIEAYVTPRYEFKKLKADSNAPTWLYATARVGFVAVTRRAALYPNTHVGMGSASRRRPVRGQHAGGWLGQQRASFPARSGGASRSDGLMTLGLDGAWHRREGQVLRADVHRQRRVGGSQLRQHSDLSRLRHRHQEFFGNECLPVGFTR